MCLEPPQGSKITVSEEGLERVIKIHPKSEEVMKFVIGFLLVLWLGGWLLGVYEDFEKVVSSKGDIFLLIQAVAGLAAGLCAGYFIYVVFRPFVPETLRLGADSVYYDSGFPPFHLELDFDNPKGIWRPMLPKRTWIKLERQVLQTLALREFDSGNRLTVDLNAQRIDIGKSASEVEREWLYEVLSKNYT
jgi:hypothetical protein